MRPNTRLSTKTGANAGDGTASASSRQRQTQSESVVETTGAENQRKNHGGTTQRLHEVEQPNSNARATRHTDGSLRRAPMNNSGSADKKVVHELSDSSDGDSESSDEDSESELSDIAENEYAGNGDEDAASAHASSSPPVATIRASSAESDASVWSDNEMRTLQSLATDDMLDASQSPELPVPSPKRKRRSHDKENIPPTSASAPLRTAHPQPSRPEGPLRQRNGPIQPTAGGIRVDTPRPITITIPRVRRTQPIERPPRGALSGGAPAQDQRPAPHQRSGGDDARPPRKRTAGDRSPVGPKTIRQETEGAPPKKARRTDNTVASNDIFGLTATPLQHPEHVRAGAGSSSESRRSDASLSPQPRRAHDNTNLSQPPPIPTAPGSPVPDPQPASRSPSPPYDPTSPAPAASTLQTPRIATGTPADLMRSAAVSRDVRPNSSTMDRTNTPTGGFPIVDVALPGWLFANQQHDQLEAWPALGGAKVIASIFGKGALDHRIDNSQSATIGLLETTVASFTGNENVRASPPIPIDPPRSLNSAPYGILVYNLTDAQAQQLLELRCLSTIDITLLFFPFAIQLPRLVLSFGGISNRTVDEVRRMAVVNLRLDKNQQILLDLTALSPELTIDRSPKRAVHDIIQSAVVTSSAYLARRAVPLPVFNLFMDIPVGSAEIWIRWRDALRELEWSDAELGSVTVRGLREVRCDGCQAGTHYHWACPFMPIKDWHGTMPESVNRKTSTPNLLRGTPQGPGSFPFNRTNGGRRM